MHALDLTDGSMVCQQFCALDMALSEVGRNGDRSLRLYCFYFRNNIPFSITYFILWLVYYYCYIDIVMLCLISVLL